MKRGMMGFGKLEQDNLPEDLLKFFTDAQTSKELVRVRVPQQYGGVVRGIVTVINSNAGQVCLRTSTNPNHPIPLDLVKSASVIDLEPQKTSEGEE